MARNEEERRVEVELSDEAYALLEKLAEERGIPFEQVAQDMMRKGTRHHQTFGRSTSVIMPGGTVVETDPNEGLVEVIKPKKEN